MYSCPKGHTSTEADFCSECGAKITGVGVPEASAIQSNPPVPTGGTAAIYPCPICTTPHEDGTGDFCEICGYNFLTADRGGVPFPISPPVMPAQPLAQTYIPDSTPTSPNPPSNVPGKWQAIISIDPSLASPDSPPAPVRATQTVELTAPTNLIGRTSQARAIHPEIPLDLDDAVSSRHAILTIQADGSLILRDIGSSNGTMVNGKEIAVMADIQLHSGDKITLGHWTRIELSQN
jgi:pSer/pThr/pTyr-binding forkhead associated (FHA) protein